MHEMTIFENEFEIFQEIDMVTPRLAHFAYFYAVPLYCVYFFLRQQT